MPNSQKIYYLLDEVSNALAKLHRWTVWRESAFLGDMRGAAQRGELTVRDGPTHLPLLVGRRSIGSCRVTRTDVNKWLEAQGVDYRWEESHPQAEPCPQAELAPRGGPKRSRSDFMANEIDRAIDELGVDADQASVMTKLKSYAGLSGSCILKVLPEGVQWHDAKDRLQELDREGLRKRLDRRAKRAPK
jgi:hypothetical protein